MKIPGESRRVLAVMPKGEVFASRNRAMVFIFGIYIVFFALFFLLLDLLIRRTVTDRFYEVNRALDKIIAGDLTQTVSVRSSPEFLALSDGINTQLTKEFSEEGTNLSGGESQKVAISRIFAGSGDRTISILDEPSSALDPVSEYKLNKNLIENAKNDTIIFISHRLSTTRMADRIYLFEQGTIKEQGTHDELMALNGRYREMFDRQAQNYIV